MGIWWNSVAHDWFESSHGFRIGYPAVYRVPILGQIDVSNRGTFMECIQNLWYFAGTGCIRISCPGIRSRLQEEISQPQLYRDFISKLAKHAYRLSSRAVCSGWKSVIFNVPPNDSFTAASTVSPVQMTVLQQVSNEFSLRASQSTAFASDEHID